MNLQSSNPYGCISCFCYGHSSVCRVSNDYTKDEIISDFYSGKITFTVFFYFSMDIQTKVYKTNYLWLDNV